MSAIKWSNGMYSTTGRYDAFVPTEAGSAYAFHIRQLSAGTWEVWCAPAASVSEYPTYALAAKDRKMVVVAVERTFKDAKLAARTYLDEIAHGRVR